MTAATILDDVAEILDRRGRGPRPVALRRGQPCAPTTGWLVSVSGTQLPGGADVTDYLGSFGVYVRSTSSRTALNGEQHRGYLTWPSHSATVHSAAARLEAAAGCRVACTRALGDYE